MTVPHSGESRGRRLGLRRGLSVALLAALIFAALLGAAGRANAAPAHRQAFPAARTVLSHQPATPAASSPTAPSGPATPPGITLVPTLPGATLAPVPSAGPVGGGGSGGCGFLDITCHVTAAINSWFRGLVSSALNPILALLGRSVLATPEVTGPGQVRDLWVAAAGIANTIVVVFLLAAGALVMGHETLQTRYAAKDLAPRIVVAVIAANASLGIAGIAIHLANSLSAALVGPGVDPANAARVLTALVSASLATGGIFVVLLDLVAALLALVLLGVYVIRVALVVLLIAAAPLALLCHALPQTEGMARLWWRGIAGLLAIQLAQALVLITALRVFFAATGPATLGLGSSGALVDVLVAICLLYVLVRIPGWVSRAVFAGTGHSPSAAVRTVKTLVVYKALRAGFAALA